ncbi:MAG: hypothetical protein HQ568_05175, partial [Calditrichaeota bacterium]|nr:hypothetical protein [Calditrichota bacterium]
MSNHKPFLAILFFIVTLVFSLPVQSAIIDNLDPTLVRDLFLIEQYHKGSTKIGESLLKAYKLPLEADPVLKVFLHFREFPSMKQRNELKDSGVILYEYSWIPPVGAHPTGFMLGHVKSSIIRKLLKDG